MATLSDQIRTVRWATTQLTPADIMLDLLLDLRNEGDARSIVPVVDRLLAVIGHRSLLTADETLLLLDELDEAVESVKEADETSHVLELSPAGPNLRS